MFRFDFSCDSVESDTKECENKKDALKWLEAKEIHKNNAISIKKNDTNDIDTVQIGSEQILCVKPSTTQRLLKQELSNSDKYLIQAEQNHSDLITAKYEGGLKVWECTSDIAFYLEPSLVDQKTVLDLGCGIGLLGILALKLGARVVHFQDYNEDVLRLTTIPNLLLNADLETTSKCRFFCGDWESFCQITDLSCDVLLTSETIYNPDNYLKLHNIIHRVLKPSGVALVGAKSYYFGVGGSTRQFEKLVKEKGIFDVSIVWKCSEGVQREILKLTFKEET